MPVETFARPSTDTTRALSLRVVFLVLWLVDAVTASLFFVVPNGTELNPVTVLFHDLAGIPGVALAALVYATIVIVVEKILSNPLDRLFMVAVVTAYVVLVGNNVAVLAVGSSPVLELLA